MKCKPPSIIFVHVDDGCLMTTNQKAAQKGIDRLNQKNKLDSEEMNWYIGLKFEHTKDKGKLKISCPAYIEDMLGKFNMSNCNPALTPADPNVELHKNEGEPHDCPYQEAIGSLMYPSTKCRPDIIFIVNKLSSYNNNPSKVHWTAVKRVLRYMKGTKDKEVFFKRNMQKGTSLLQAIMNSKIDVYMDSDYAMDCDARRSTSGYMICLNCNLVYWASKKQAVTAQSTAEAETIAACEGVKHAQFIRKTLHEVQMILSGRAAEMNQGEQNCHSICLQSNTIDTSLFIDNKAAKRVA